MNQTFFHLVFVVVFVIFFGIRAFYQRMAYQTRGEIEYKEGVLHSTLRLIFGIPFVLMLLAYMLRPSILAWAHLPLPLWAQWVGVLLGVVSIPLIWWIHWALGSNFSTTLHIRDEHTLVTHGPYRWVRHPMYTVLYLYSISILLLTKNWLVGALFLLSLTIIVVMRINHEEASMIEKFGDEYREYMEYTGRFLPRLMFSHQNS